MPIYRLEYNENIIKIQYEYNKNSKIAYTRIMGLQNQLDLGLVRLSKIKEYLILLIAIYFY